jgi:hypothetical protein
MFLKSLRITFLEKRLIVEKNWGSILWEKSERDLRGAFDIEGRCLLVFIATARGCFLFLPASRP